MKYGVIRDAALFERLETAVGSIVAREADEIADIVRRCAAIKAAVVSADEHERTGARATLNYGHTFGHAYENATGYGTLLHGEAVAIGMADAAELAVRTGRVPRAFAVRQAALMAALGLPTCLPSGVEVAAEDLVALMARDKKALDGRLRFILPTRLGQVELVDDVPTPLVREVLAGRLADRA